MKLKHFIWLMGLVAVCGCNDDASHSKTDTEDCEVNGTCPTHDPTECEGDECTVEPPGPGDPTECEDPDGNCSTDITPCEETGTCEPDRICDDECTFDAFSCNGEDLMRCIQGDNQCTQWEIVQSCGEGTKCDATLGLCAETCGDGCNAGEFACDGATLKQCIADENGCASWEMLNTCDEGLICNADLGQCSEACGDGCNTGEFACEETVLKKCVSDENGCTLWESTETCTDGLMCNAQLGKCAEACGDSCNLGEYSCDAETLKQCTADENGCTSWTVAETCGEGQTCNAEQGQCTSQSCTNACTAEQYACDGSLLSQCKVGENGCTAWEVVQTCGDGEICNADKGQCIYECNNACTLDAKTCADGGIATCIKDEHGCAIWGASASCGANKKCDSSTVTCVDGCVNECTSGEKKCADGGMKTCGQYDSDSCTEWSAPAACGAGMKCSSDGKSCVPACTDACTQGAKKCSGTGIMTCEKKSGELCTSWSAAASCGTGMKCENNQCVKACTDACTLGAKKCSGTGIMTCEKKSGELCTSWSAAASCGTGMKCENNQCVKDCTDACTLGATKCSGDNVMTCEKKSGALCTTWSAATACGMGQRCESSKCTYTCGSEADCKPFSIVFVPDTQYYTRKKGCSSMSESESRNIEQMQKLAAKKSSWNIKYVVHLGDMTQKNIVEDYNKLSQWGLASKAHKVLDDADIPNLPATGNHDYKKANWDTTNGKCKSDDVFTNHSDSHFSEYFNAKRYSGKSWAPKVFSNSANTMYGTFKVGNIKFLIIALEYAARKETLCEADKLISAHPDHHVIITMHNYMNKSGHGTHNYTDVLYGARGDDASAELAQRHKNVFLVVGGHVSGSFYRETVKGTNGNLIREMLVDYQSESPKMCDSSGNDSDINNGGNGWVRRIEIDPKKGTMKATTESMLGFTKMFCTNLYPEDPTKMKDANTGHTPAMTGMDFGKTPTDNYKVGTYAFTTRQIGTGSRHQMNGAIAMNRNTKTDGIFVTVWEDDASKDDGDGNYDIRARISCTGGCNKSGFFYVNDLTTGNQAQPDVAMDANGNFVVVWADDNDGNNKYEIHMRGYKADGSQLFARKKVNTVATGQQLYPKVAMADDGRFVVVWQDSSAGYDQVFMRGFKADGSELFAQKVAAGGASGTYRYPDIAMSSDGHFVVAWEDDNDGNGATQLKAQGFNINGTSQFNSFVVNKDSTRDQTRPAVAMNSKGDYTIAWLDERTTKNVFVTYVRGFKAGTSTELIAEKPVSPAGKNTKHPDIVMDDSGNLGVVWEIVDGDPNKDAKYCDYKNSATAGCNDIQRINYKGGAWKTAERVNNNPYSGHSAPAIGIDKGGRNVVLWNDDSDGNGAYDIYMRGYNSL